MTSDEAVKTLLNYLTINDSPKRADAIFVFGGLNLSPVEKAAEIFKQGLTNKVVFIGKKGPFTPEDWSSEADQYHKRFLELGILEENLLWEPLSANTLEDAKLSVPFMQKHNINPKTLILVTRPFHQRRAYATFKKQHPLIEYINIPANDVYPNTDQAIKRLMAEVDRIKDFGEKGDIEKQEIPENVNLAYQFLKESFNAS